MTGQISLAEVFDEIDNAILEIERLVAAEDTHALGEILSLVKPLLRRLLAAYRSDLEPKLLQTDDLLEVFKAFVKGDPSLNSIRDNVRELVYYENCLTMSRDDALPKNPQRMAVRTLRHVYLYLRSRAEQDGRFD